MQVKVLTLCLQLKDSTEQQQRTVTVEQEAQELELSAARHAHKREVQDVRAAAQEKQKALAQALKAEQVPCSPKLIHSLFEISFQMLEC